MASSPDQRNDDAAGEESAPLLSAEVSAPAQPGPERAIHLLTSFALSCAVLAIVLIIVTNILVAVQPYSYIPWETRNAMNIVVIIAIFSILLGGVNLARIRRGRPFASLAVNLIVDGLIAFFTIIWAGQGLGGVVGYRYDSWDDRLTQVMAGIAMVLALLFGLFHLVLFALRCRKAFLTNSFEGPWSLPGGQLTLEISIKSFKEPQKPRQSGEEEV